jgi:hypothetical protein
LRARTSPVAVDDQAAVGHDRHQRNAIVLGAGLVVVVLHDLQPDEADEQQAEAEQTKPPAKARRERKRSSSS